MAFITGSIAYTGDLSGNTPAANITGAKLMVMAVVVHGAVTITMGDSTGDTVTKGTERGAWASDGPRHSVQMGYVINPTTATNFAATQPNWSTSGNGALAFLAFDDVGATYDKEAWNNSTTGATLMVNGTVSPTATNSLIVAAWGVDDPTCTGATPFTVDNGFTIVEYINNIPAANHGLVIAYKYVTGTSAISPTVTRSVANTQNGDEGVLMVFSLPSSVILNEVMIGPGGSQYQIGPGAPNQMRYSPTPIF